jgi:hypothetical protein
MPIVFINYRGAADNFAATLIYNELTARFGTEHIFRTPDSLRPGDDFDSHIWKALDRCSILLAIMERDWLFAGKDGRRYLDDPEDYVRREIAEALRLHKRVIPVMIADAPIPRAADVPGDVAALVRRQVVRVYAKTVSYDLQPLIAELARQPELQNLSRAAAPPEVGADGAAHGPGPVGTPTPFHHGGVVFGGTAEIGGDVVSGDKHVSP